MVYDTGVTYDLLIVGAGITGLGIYERAVRMGFKTLLVEQKQPGKATTAVTSGLLHGGLRYIPYDAATSLEMGREAGRLSRLLPDAVFRRSFLWPVYSGHRLRLQPLEALMELYDDFGRLRNGLPHVRLSASETAGLEPALETKGLQGSLVFDEWQVEVPKLVQSLLEGAGDGEVWKESRVIGFTKDLGRLSAAQVRMPDGTELEVEAKVFVNAGGPWAQEVSEMAGSPKARLTLRKGVHLILRGPSTRFGLIFPELSGRYIGLFPRDGEAWVGPTDTAFDGRPEDVVATGQEKEDLRKAVRRVLPGCKAEMTEAAAGLRPLYRQGGSAAFFSRDFRVLDHAGEGICNFVSVIGGKLTTFAPMADAALQVLAPKLGAAPPMARALEPLAFPLSVVDEAKGTRSLIFSGILFLWALLRRGWRAAAGGSLRGLDAYKRHYEPSSR